MEREIKYTTDGKKVVVIGNLNAQEKIVQEIFIVNGQEVPSGENFVVKSLHDAPAISWHEKRKKELEECYNTMRKEEEEIRKKHRIVCDSLREKISYISKACNKLTPESFDLLSDYITGNIKFIVQFDYEIKIIPMDVFNESYDGKLRLISFFGKDDGSFSYAIGQYYDYSGGSTQFIPCRTYEEAVRIVRGHLEKKDVYYDYDVKSAQKYNIELAQDKLDIYNKKRLDGFRANLKKAQDEVNKWESLLNEPN